MWQSVGLQRVRYKLATEQEFIAMLCYAKSLQSCPTLCNPIDASPPGSAVPGILQARALERAAISFSFSNNRTLPSDEKAGTVVLVAAWTHLRATVLRKQSQRKSHSYCMDLFI